MYNVQVINIDGGYLMKYFKRLASVLLATALLLSACSGADTSWAFKSGNTQVTAGLYILYEVGAFSEAEQKIVADMENYTGMKSSELLKQQLEGKPVSDWIKEKSADSVKEYIAIKEKFESMGLYVSDSETAAIDSNLGTIKMSSGDFYTKNGIAESSLRDYYTGYARENGLFSALYGEGGEFEVKTEELKKNFSDNYAMIDILLMYKPYAVPEGETKTLEQLIAEDRTKAEEYLNRLKNGEEIEELVYEWQTSDATEEQKANMTKPEKGELSMVVSESGRANYGDVLTDAALGANVGDVRMVEEDEFFIVFKKTDIMEDSEVFESYKNTVLQEMKFDEYKAKVKEWAAAVQIDVNDAAIKKYKPEIIKFD